MAIKEVPERSLRDGLLRPLDSARGPLPQRPSQTHLAQKQPPLYAPAPLWPSSKQASRLFVKIAKHVLIMKSWNALRLALFFWELKLNRFGPGRLIWATLMPPCGEVKFFFCSATFLPIKPGIMPTTNP